MTMNTTSDNRCYMAVMPNGLVLLDWELSPRGNDNATLVLARHPDGTVYVAKDSHRIADVGEELTADRAYDLAAAHNRANRLPLRSSMDFTAQLRAIKAAFRDV